MRKILLAGAAMLAIVGTAAATATTTSTTQIQATVTASCQTPTSTALVSFGTNPVVNATATGSVTLQCNFAGDNAGNLAVNFSSLNGGIQNGTSLKTYDLAFGASSATSTVLKATGLSAPTSLAAANSSENQPFNLTLTQAPDVAGTYSDTLTISVSY